MNNHLASFARLLMGILFLLTLSNTGMCCGSGLLVIPTADTVGDGQYSGEFQTDGVVSGAAIHTVLINNQVGIGDRVEVGVDFVPRGTDSTKVLGNFKYVAATTKDNNFAVAFGLQDIARHKKPSFFGVTSTQTPLGRIHFGAMTVEAESCWIVGFEREFGKAKFMCDCTSAGVNPASIGLGYQFTPTFGIEGGVLLPGGGEKTEFSIHLVWNADLKSKK